MNQREKDFHITTLDSKEFECPCPSNNVCENTNLIFDFPSDLLE